MKQTLRIGTYNIWHAGRVKEDVGALGRALAGLELDIVGLQEVDVKTARMDGLDTLKIIAEAGGYPYYAFAKALEKACIETIEAGEVTGDLAALIGPGAKKLTSLQFLRAVRSRVRL